MDFRFKNRGLNLDVYSSTHMGVDFHTRIRGDKDAETTVSASHYPRKTETEDGPREEFYSLGIREIAHGEQRSNDVVTVFMDRETLESIHFAAGELLAQSEGIGDNAADGIVTAQVERRG